jgi:chromosome segregation ATPase
MSLAGLFEEISKVREGQVALAQQLAWKKAQIQQVEEQMAASNDQRRAFESELALMLRHIWTLEAEKVSTEVSLRLQKQQQQASQAHFDALVKTVAQITTQTDQARESLMVKLADVQRAPYPVDYLAEDRTIDLDAQRAVIEQVQADNLAWSQTQQEHSTWEERLLETNDLSAALQQRTTDLEALLAEDKADEEQDAELEQEKLSLERAVLEQNYIAKHLVTQQKENKALEEKRQRLKKLEDELDDEIISCQHQNDRLFNSNKSQYARSSGAAFISNKSQRTG